MEDSQGETIMTQLTRGGSPGVDRGRRDFLRGAGSLALLSSLPLELAVSAPPDRGGRARDAAFPGVITRQKDPDNLEFPFPTLNRFLTPTEHFYVRTRFGVAELAVDAWRPQVERRVDQRIAQA